MTKILLSILLFCLPLFLFISCEELYVPKVKKSQKEFLVVNGKISNVGESVQVRLTKAIGFNSSESTYDSTTNAVSGAIVAILDDIGDSVVLKEMGNGYYKADNYHGSIGRTYKLQIKTFDGSMYESKPEMILPYPKITTLVAELGEKDVLKMEVYGPPIIDKLFGVNIFVDVKTNESERIYCKFNTRMVTETRTKGLVNGFKVLLYCWNVDRLNSKLCVSEASLENGVRVIKHLNLGFIQEVPYEINGNVRGWLLSCTISRISEPEYLYYSEFTDQLNADSKIFDPLPTQLLSNIRCITDSTKVVLGYFSVLSELTIDYFVLHNEGNEIIHQHYINTLPQDISSKCQDSPPDFWTE
jgi:hypothetical protein